MILKINGKGLNKFKTLEDALKEIDYMVKKYDGELGFLLSTGMSPQEARLMIANMWNELHKENKQEKSQDKEEVNTQEINQKKTPQKDDIVKVLVEPFRGQKFKVVDICKDMRAILIDLGDEFQNTFRLGFEDVEIVEEKEKIMEENLNMCDYLEKLAFPKLKITKDKTYVIADEENSEVVGDISYGYQDKDFDKEKSIEMAFWHCVKNYAKQKLSELSK